MAAFTDPSTAAVVASIGGDDQLTVLPHLDPDVLRAHPKPFLGYSDNTSLLVYLDTLGIPGLHGGATMVHLGRAGRMHPVTEASLRAALFTSGPWEVPAPTEYTDVHGDWATDDLTVEPTMRAASAWSWHGPRQGVRGRLWGGNPEILSWTLGVNKHLLPSYDGRVLLLETSEEMPGAAEVYRFLRVMGERGLLQQFVGLVMGRPKAWSPERPDLREDYTRDQHAAVLRGLAEYAPTMTAVLDVDCGHTDPMVVMPIGREVLLDPPGNRVVVTY
jgi:muramoyltetrapeptide carboxypeptidase LdcA involved in peptidoglycan recycling